VSERKPSPFSPSKEIIGHIDRLNGESFAHIVIPLCAAKYAEWEKNAPDFQQFANSLHATVIELSSRGPIGWIVDLRGNGGGNMWPMLAGIGALLGEDDLGAFISADGDRTPWHYRDGQAGTLRNIQARITERPFLLQGIHFVAVLFDRGTSSSGEAVAISFAGRPRQKSFGEHTAGFSTSNGRYPLSDGAVLFLCNGIEADRTGKIYPDGLDPDVKIEEPEVRPSENQDQAIRAAEEWLTEQSLMPSNIEARVD
jgi:carboxyl-terminal processing protease